jgi:hypothetical protein
MAGRSAIPTEKKIGVAAILGATGCELIKVKFFKIF